EEVANQHRRLIVPKRGRDGGDAARRGDLEGACTVNGIAGIKAVADGVVLGGDTISPTRGAAAAAHEFERAGIGNDIGDRLVVPLDRVPDAGLDAEANNPN